MDQIESHANTGPATTADAEKSKVSRCCDEGAKIFDGDGPPGEIELEFSEKEAATARWKIDLTIVPMVCLSMQYAAVSV